MGEVLADAAPAAESLQRRRVHLRGLRVERHVAVERKPDGLDRLRRTGARRNCRVRIIRELRLLRQPRRGGEIVVRRVGREQANGGGFLRQRGRGR